MSTVMSKKEAIKKLGCKEKECNHLDENGVYTFCRALRTKNSCFERAKEIREFYTLAKKYGFQKEAPV